MKKFLKSSVLGKFRVVSYKIEKYAKPKDYFAN